IGEPLASHTDAVWDVTFLPDGERLLSAGLDESVILWNIRPQQRFAQRLIGHTEPVWTVSASSDGRWLATGGGETSTDGEDFGIRLWDMQKCAGTQPCAPTNVNLEGHDAMVTTGAFSPDGRWFASGSADRSIR